MTRNVNENSSLTSRRSIRSLDRCSGSSLSTSIREWVRSGDGLRRNGERTGENARFYSHWLAKMRARAVVCFGTCTRRKSRASGRFTRALSSNEHALAHARARSVATRPFTVLSLFFRSYVTFLIRDAYGIVETVFNSIRRRKNSSTVP